MNERTDEKREKKIELKLHNGVRYYYLNRILLLTGNGVLNY